jgi:hypothetical protein
VIQILKRQTSRSHYGSKVPAVTITVFKYRNKIGKIVVKAVLYIYSPKKETQHVKKYNFTSNFQHHFKYINKHYITLKFGTVVVQA